MDQTYDIVDGTSPGTRSVADNGRMRHSEFWQAMDHVFGKDYAKSLASDLVMGRLGGRTAAEALAGAVDPREVWAALCDAMDVPEPRRHAYGDSRSTSR